MPITYTQGDYEITEYSGSGSVREKLTGIIVGSYVNYWTRDGSIHPQTKNEIEHIREKLGVTIHIMHNNASVDD